MAAATKNLFFIVNKVFYKKMFSLNVTTNLLFADWGPDLRFQIRHQKYKTIKTGPCENEPLAGEICFAAILIVRSVIGHWSLVIK
jgi:hypothetical protein